jgi:dTDP-4-amino-4,6-dideoxygalactose transaminase
MTVRLVHPAPGSRNALVARLNARGIGTSIYYPQPVPRMTFYRRKYGYDAAAFPGASLLSDDSVALPVGPHLGEDDMLTIAAEFQQALQDIHP